MSDYSTLGAFSTGGASALNGDIIQKLKDAESKSIVDPLDKKLDDWQLESDKMVEINEKLDAFYNSIKTFDLFSSSSNIFEQVSASTTGESVIFDALDVTKLKEGTMTVEVTQLAQKDVYQTNTFSDPTVQIDGGDDDGDKITIKIDTDGDGDIDDDDDDAIEFSTEDKTYEELAEEINNNSNFSASIEKVSDDEYRLVIKSAQEGKALQITEDGVDLGLGEDDNHILEAQNLQATVDGVEYDVSSNTITVDGNLKITGVAEGTSTISVSKDTSVIQPAIEELAKTYNDLVSTIDGAIYSEDSVISDPSSLRTLVSDIKQAFYKTVGDDEESLFGFGISFDYHGSMVVDSTKLGSALVTNLDDIKSLFLGTADDKGVGTQLKEYIDFARFPGGIIDNYTDHMTERKTKLEEEKEDTVKKLDIKYDTMARQFAAYGALITQMESSFSGLKMTIQQSIASK